jgi:hypothetical protein
MKVKSSLLLFIVGMTMISCFGSRDYIVESDYSYAGDFKRYKTFSFIHQQRFDLDSLIPEDIIMKTIANRLAILGYRQTEQKPNLLIAFRMYYDDFDFTGWNQPEFELWLKEKGYVKEEFEEIKYRLKEGTLIILLVDRKSNRTVWQGYNSGLIDINTLENERFIKGSVRLIFDKYRVFADGYLKES